MTDETQPVAPVVDTAPAAQSETTSAQTATPDLSTFLDEYEAQANTAPPPAPQAAAAPTDEVAELKRRMIAFEQRDLATREATDRADVFKKIKGDLPVDDYTVRGFLDAKAESNPKINQIWANRYQDPKAAAKLVKSLHSELAAERARQPDRNATDDRQAVAAAMRGGSSTTAPAEQAPNYGSMNEAQFAAEKAKLGL